MFCDILGLTLDTLLEVVAMSVTDFGENSNALQDVYIIKGQVMLQEQTVNGKNFGIGDNARIIFFHTFFFVRNESQNGRKIG